jgi:indole-3-acetate monooxygenase
MSVTPPEALARLARAVRDVLPRLQAATLAIDQDRRVPAEVTAALRAAGVYRMCVPTDLGGDQVDLQAFLDVVEVVSQGTGAVGWATTSRPMPWSADGRRRRRWA